VGYERFDADAYAWPIDELSYKPANGWENEDPESFMGVDAKYRDLARATIWKTFRIVEDDQELPGKSQFSKSQKAWEQAAQGSGQAALQYVDKVFRLDDRTRILPLDSAQVGLDFFSDKWRPDRKPAQVLGYFYDRKQGAKNSGTKPASIPDNARHFGTTSNVEATTPELIYGGGYDDPNNRGNKDGRRFSLDLQTGIVKFDEPVIYLNRDANGVASRAAPLLFLRTSFVIRDIEKRQPLKQQYWYRLPNGVPGLVKTIDAPALEYEFALTEAGESKTDYAEFEREALYYCEKELRRYVANEAATIPMRGFVFNYDVDGAIRWCLRFARRPPKTQPIKMPGGVFSILRLQSRTVPMVDALYHFLAWLFAVQPRSASKSVRSRQRGRWTLAELPSPLSRKIRPKVIVQRPDRRG
jgi:hypothetical protein